MKGFLIGKISTSKEVSNLAYSMQKSGQVKDDDWANIYNQLDRWKENGLVIYFQAYDPNNEDQRNVLLS